MYPFIGSSTQFKVAFQIPFIWPSVVMLLFWELVRGPCHGKGQASELQFVRKYSQKIVRVMSRSSPERSGNVVGIGPSCHHSQPQCVVTAL
jgi:hypothetical protein